MSDIFGLKEKVGIVPCAVEVKDATSGTARFRLPRLPFVWGEGKETKDCAWALGLDPTEIVSGGFVPIESIPALAQTVSFCPDGLAALEQFRRRGA